MPTNGWQLLWDFESAAPPAGISVSGQGTRICGGSIATAAQPAGSTGCFFAVPDANIGSTGTATFTFSTYITGVSFYWGSIDTYNSVRFFDGATQLSFDGGLGNVLTGDEVPSPADGNQGSSNTNKRVYFNFNGANVTRMELTSTSYAFEIDDLAISAVPEPSTYVLMGAGLLGLAGVARRRRNA